MKRPLPDGTPSLVFTGVELLRRLAALVPPSRVPLLHFHGVFAPGAAFRSRLAPSPAPDVSVETSSGGQPPKRRRPPRGAHIDWASLLKRTFRLDVLLCPHCGARRRVLAALNSSSVVIAVLRHLGLPHRPPPLAPSRGPPVGALWA